MITHEMGGYKNLLPNCENTRNTDLDRGRTQYLHCYDSDAQRYTDFDEAKTQDLQYNDNDEPYLRLPSMISPSTDPAINSQLYMNKNFSRHTPFDFPYEEEQYSPSFFENPATCADDAEDLYVEEPTSEDYANTLTDEESVLFDEFDSSNISGSLTDTECPIKSPFPPITSHSRLIPPFEESMGEVKETARIMSTDKAVRGVKESSNKRAEGGKELYGGDSGPRFERRPFDYNDAIRQMQMPGTPTGWEPRTYSPQLSSTPVETAYDDCTDPSTLSDSAFLRNEVEQMFLNKPDHNCVDWDERADLTSPAFVLSPDVSLADSLNILNKASNSENYEDVLSQVTEARAGATAHDAEQDLIQFSSEEGDDCLEADDDEEECPEDEEEVQTCAAPSLNITVSGLTPEQTTCLLSSLNKIICGGPGSAFGASASGRSCFSPHVQSVCDEDEEEDEYADDEEGCDGDEDYDEDIDCESPNIVRPDIFCEFPGYDNTDIPPEEFKALVRNPSFEAEYACFVPPKEYQTPITEPDVFCEFPGYDNTDISPEEFKEIQRNPSFEAEYACFVPPKEYQTPITEPDVFCEFPGYDNTDISPEKFKEIQRNPSFDAEYACFVPPKEYQTPITEPDVFCEFPGYDNTDISPEEFKEIQRNPSFDAEYACFVPPKEYQTPITEPDVFCEFPGYDNTDISPEEFKEIQRNPSFEAEYACFVPPKEYQTPITEPDVFCEFPGYDNTDISPEEFKALLETPNPELEYACSSPPSPHRSTSPQTTYDEVQAFRRQCAEKAGPFTSMDKRTKSRQAAFSNTIRNLKSRCSMPTAVANRSSSYQQPQQTTEEEVQAFRRECVEKARKFTNMNSRTESKKAEFGNAIRYLRSKYANGPKEDCEEADIDFNQSVVDRFNKLRESLPPPEFEQACDEDLEGAVGGLGANEVYDDVDCAVGASPRSNMGPPQSPPRARRKEPLPFPPPDWPAIRLSPSQGAIPKSQLSPTGTGSYCPPARQAPTYCPEPQRRQGPTQGTGRQTGPTRPTSKQSREAIRQAAAVAARAAVRSSKQIAGRQSGHTSQPSRENIKQAAAVAARAAVREINAARAQASNQRQNRDRFLQPGETLPPRIYETTNRGRTIGAERRLMNPMANIRLGGRLPPSHRQHPDFTPITDYRQPMQPVQKCDSFQKYM